ncbi:hypothetical protein KL86CLO1_10458 [uncultured Eubacteriales bacterium]|uniref:Uncharacterized protein n=1 Tax=uncultured Eubacteriales bacterium TaxID=172733 RepID=A0A212J3J6_9FIRM|nr:hypothetical protein KL86CLO1_10458 [uncultured Eubacteriales bacterium]
MDKHKKEVWKSMHINWIDCGTPDIEITVDFPHKPEYPTEFLDDG